MTHAHLKIVEPLLNAIVPHWMDYPWLVDFYRNEIKAWVDKTIQEYLDATEQRNCRSHKSPLDKLSSLMRYFRSIDRSHPDHDCMIQLFQTSHDLHFKLQNSIINAFARGLISFELEIRLPSHTSKMIKEILEMEVLLKMKERLEQMSYSIKMHPTWHILTHWVAKEMKHLGPKAERRDSEPGELAIKRSFEEASFLGSWLNKAWYFVCGERYLILFFKREVFMLKKLYDDYLDAVARFNLQAYEQRNLLLLPQVSFQFLLNALNMMFLPYRFLCTATNEISFRTYHALKRLFGATPMARWTQEVSIGSFAVSVVVYLGMAYSLGLSWLPTIFSWQPAIDPIMLLCIPCGYAVSVLLGCLGSSLLQEVHQEKKSNKREQKVEALICTEEKQKSRLDYFNIQRMKSRPVQAQEARQESNVSPHCRP